MPLIPVMTFIAKCDQCARTERFESREYYSYDLPAGWTLACSKPLDPHRVLCPTCTRKHFVATT